MLACHDACHLIRAIGHHIDRLACRSVSIMGWPSPWRAGVHAGVRGAPAVSNVGPICRVPDRFGAGLMRLKAASHGQAAETGRAPGF